jgi:hypothetical protein
MHTSENRSVRKDFIFTLRAWQSFVKKDNSNMPRALRRIAFYLGATGVLLTPLLGCALSVNGLSTSECVVLPDGDRVSMSSIVRRTPYAAAFATSGTLALAALTDALTEYDATRTGRVLACVAFLALLVTFAVPTSGADSLAPMKSAPASSWAHSSGAMVGTFALWCYALYTTQREANVAALTIFCGYTIAAGLAASGAVVDGLRGEEGARQLVAYGALWGEFGAAGATLGLFNYVTRNDGSGRKIFNI